MGGDLNRELVRAMALIGNDVHRGNTQAAAVKMLGEQERHRAVCMTYIRQLESLIGGVADLRVRLEASGYRERFEKKMKGDDV